MHASMIPFDPLIIVLLYVSKLQVLCKNKQIYVFVVVPQYFYKVIYSLNLDLANKCIPLKNQYRSACSTLVCFNICLKQSFNTLLPLSMSVNDWNFPHLLFFRYFILLNTKRRLKNYPSYIIIEIKKELIGYKTSDCLSR